MTRRSLIKDFSGLTLCDFRILAKPSDFENGFENKRAKTDVGAGLMGISVYTSNAPETIGERSFCIWEMSPV